MNTPAEMQFFHLGARTRAVLTRALILLVVWSSSALAISCDEQEVALGGEPKGISAPGHPPHQHGAHCPPVSIHATAVPMKGTGDDPVWPSPPAGSATDIPDTGLAAWQRTVPEVRLVFEETHSPPLYLIYHRFLIHLPS